jgi:hypothetical protein
MSALSDMRHERKMLRKWLRKWFGANNGTHWNIAGAVAVIILGAYLIYNIHDSSHPAATTIVASERSQVPMTPGPHILKK